ncbi:MAG TPA: aldolase [Candidatus Blautia intestinipullorum]|nr:aldolase [Candidatus Blautia intestinipullorum]
MALKLMYITNNPDIARIAEDAGVDRIFIDMEYIGKSARQGGMDTVQSHHTVDDVRRIRKVISKAQLMVRINPLHKGSTEYGSSKEEIDAVIEAGADLVMLPYFTTVREIEDFVMLVDGRAKVFPLLESAKALELVDQILEVPGIDEVHVGINDLSLDLHKKFMFELLMDGTVEELCYKFKKKGIPYGFGGIGRIGKGDLPAENIIREHYRLGSTCAILSRSFCNANDYSDLEEIRHLFNEGVKEIRNLEKECELHAMYFQENEKNTAEKVYEILEKK